MSQPDERQLVLPLSQLTFYLAEGCSLACRRCSMPSGTFTRLTPPRTGSLNGAGRVTGSLNGFGRVTGGLNGARLGTAPLPHGTAPLRKPDFTPLPTATILQAIREALPLGLRVVQLSGGSRPEGEPLLHPDFDTLVERLESLNLSVVIETSGAGLTPARAARLARLPQCSTAIGLDGADAETHDAIHGQPGSFVTVTDAVTMLAQYGLAPQIIFNVMRSNVHQILQVVRLAESLGAESLHLVVDWPGRYQLPGNNGHSSRGGQEALSVEQLIAVGRKVERELSRGTHMQLIFDQPPAFRGLHASARVDGHGRCGILNSLAVLPDGSYALCGIAAGFAFGSAAVDRAAEPSMIFCKVGELPLERIWREHPTLCLLRGGMPDRLEGVCERCVMKTACLGNCPAENYQRTGSLWGPYWFCEAAEQVGLFPASRLIENRW